MVIFDTISWGVNNSVIPVTKSVKTLGLHSNRLLKWDEQIYKTVKKNEQVTIFFVLQMSYPPNKFKKATHCPINVSPF